MRPRSFDRLLLTLLLAGSATMLIVACSKDRRQAYQPDSVRSMPHSLQNHQVDQPAISDLSYAIDRRWSQVPEEMAGGIDAAINWEKGDYSWFRGDRFVTLGRDLESQTGSELQNLESAGTGQNEFWPGMPFPEVRQIDAALHWDRNTAYFFSGDQYVTFDQLKGEFEAPRSISSASASNPWRVLPPSFQEGIDAAVNDGLGNILIFKGKEYLRFDRYLGQVIDEPALISERWPVLPQEFHEGIDAAMRMGRGRVILFRDGLNVEIITSEAL